MIRKDHPVFFIIVVAMNVVLLHGFCESAALWDDVMEELHDIPGLNLYAPDIPGFGNSGSVIVHGIDQMAGYLLNDLTIRNINRFVVMGHSMGGYIALEMLHQAPDRVEGLSLINSTGKDDDALKKANRAKTVSFIKKNGLSRFLNELGRNLVAPVSISNAAIMDKVNKLLGGTRPEGVINALESMATRADHTTTLKDCPIPVMMAGGKHDMILPPPRIFEEAVLPVTCMVESFENAGHCLPLEAPADLAAMIRKFLKPMLT